MVLQRPAGVGKLDSLLARLVGFSVMVKVKVECPDRWTTTMVGMSLPMRNVN